MIKYNAKPSCSLCGGKEKKEEKKTLFKTTIDGCGEHEEKIIHAAVDIPTTLPTETTLSKVIKISYLIQASRTILFYIFQTKF